MDPITRMITALKDADARSTTLPDAIEAWKRGVFGNSYAGPIKHPVPTASQVSELSEVLAGWADLHAPAIGAGPALRAFRDAWNRRSGPTTSGLSWTPGAWEADEWKRTATTADTALNALRTYLHAQRPDEPPEWFGNEWDALEPLPRRLLLHLRGKERVTVEDLIDQVWGREPATVSDNAIRTALSKANAFLRAINSNHHLSRAEGIVYWD
jgi:hypothetical protein